MKAIIAAVIFLVASISAASADQVSPGGAENADVLECRKMELQFAEWTDRVFQKIIEDSAQIYPKTGKLTGPAIMANYRYFIETLSFSKHYDMQVAYKSDDIVGNCGLVLGFYQQCVMDILNNMYADKTVPFPTDKGCMGRSTARWILDGYDQW